MATANEGGIKSADERRLEALNNREEEDNDFSHEYFNSDEDEQSMRRRNKGWK